jgi:hypothetical protein
MLISRMGVLGKKGRKKTAKNGAKTCKNTAEI